VERLLAIVDEYVERVLSPLLSGPPSAPLRAAVDTVVDLYVELGQT